MHFTSISPSTLLIKKQGKEANIFFLSTIANLYDRQRLQIKPVFYIFLYFPEEERSVSKNTKLSDVSKVTQLENGWRWV